MIPSSTFKHGHQKSLGPFILRMIEQTIRWSLFKDLALIEETDMIRKPAGKTCLVGDPSTGPGWGGGHA
jgi:hypothetical protein